MGIICIATDLIGRKVQTVVKNTAVITTAFPVGIGIGYGIGQP